MPNLKRRHLILGSVGAAGALVIGWLATPERRRLNPSKPLAAAPVRPSDADIDNAMRGNICRCGTYPRIRTAIHLAAKNTA